MKTPQPQVSPRLRSRARRIVGALLALATAASQLASAPASSPPMWGVNLAGAEFGSSALPGTHGVNYTYPGVEQLDYYKARGIELIRLPFKWERLQHTLYGSLNTAELSRIDAFLDLAEQRGMRVILDMHNYARYSISGTSHVIGTSQVPRAAFQDVWEKIAAHVKNRDCLWAYGIMNEPYGVGAHTWKDSAQFAVNGIRNHDMRHAILLPGDVYSGAHTWLANGANLLTVVDPADNVIFEAHQYFDANSSGTYPGTYDSNGANPNTGVSRITNFVNWCNTNGVRGFLGEYGVPDNDPRWLTLLDNTLAHMVANNISGTYWAGGPMWDDYALSTEMRRVHDEAPQMSVLIPRGSGVGTRHWPAFTWYKDAVVNGPQGSFTYDYKSATATLAVNFADANSAIGNYSTKKGVTLSYTIPSGGYAGAGMQITGGAALAPNFARDHHLTFSLRGTAGSSVRIFLRDVDGAQSAKVNTASYVTTTGTWQKVSIPLSAFVAGGFTGTKRIDRVAFEGLPINNTAHTIRLDNFIFEKPEITGPATTVASPGGATFAAGSSFTATAAASDLSGIDFVEFLLNGERVAIDETAPYAATLTLPVAGQYRLAAIAYDLHGNPGRSTPLALVATEVPARTLLANDTWEQTSFTSGARWSDGQIPHSGATYVVDGLDLRTPGNTSSHTFGGDALLLQDGGRLVMRTTGSGVVTVPHLYSDDGDISLALNGTFTLAGNLTLQSGGLNVGSVTSNRTLTITSQIAGPGELSVSMANATDHVTLTNPANAHAGGTTVTTGTLRAQALGALGSGAVVVAPAATLHLAFTGVDTMRALSLDGGATYVAPGVWGAVGSGAANTSARITGAGRLSVTHSAP